MSLTITQALTERTAEVPELCRLPFTSQTESSQNRPWQQPNLGFYPQFFALYFIFLAPFQAGFDDVRRDTAWSALLSVPYFRLSPSPCHLNVRLLFFFRLY